MFEENEDEITSLYKNRPDDDIMPDAEREVTKIIPAYHYPTVGRRPP